MGVSVVNLSQYRYFNPVLLFHSVFRSVPKSLEGNIHNLAPDELRRILDYTCRFYDVVPVDSLYDVKKSDRPVAAITFDDAYQSVFDNALKILEEFNIPATIYVNFSSISNVTLWRDKVRYIIANELVIEFCNWAIVREPGLNICIKNFYRSSKSRSTNSLRMMKLIDDFLDARNISLNNYCVAGATELVDHDLLWYGNHTYSHPVLASLSREEQVYEVKTNHDLMRKLTRKSSNLFSVPFGGLSDYNSDTIEI